MKKQKKLSHIIVAVENSIPHGDICAFCTNVCKSRPDIRFTYNCYDNQSPESLYKLLNNYDSSKEELFVITDSQTIINFTNNIGVAAVGLYTQENKKSGLSHVLYCIEDIEFVDFSTIYRMWQRFWRIPWTIAITQRLIIREQIPEDIDDLYRIYKDPEVTRYTENLYPDKEEELKYLQDYVDKQYRYYEYGIWAIEKKDTKELIGRAGVSLRPGCDDLELGFVIGKDYQKKGYAIEACEAIVDYACKELYAKRIVAYCHPKNTASIGLLKKLGFESQTTINTMTLFLLTKQ